MAYTTILPAQYILVIACPVSPLPVFYTEADRPAYVSKWVRAIFPAHIERPGSCHHTCIVEFGTDLGELFAQIAEDYARQLEAEAHDLATMDEVPDYAYQS